MPKKRTDKKNSYLEAQFQDILFCQKEEYKPYLEIFVKKPENVQEQNMGILAGILEIEDESEDSSYIVNYLVSVIKKEYYSQTKRGVIESFEAALKKANLALSKLAEHENISWLGKINALILAIEKNNIHLAQTGRSQAFLLRKNAFSQISATTSNQLPNPLKTFTDVLSGRIEKDDKLIITTESMFDIFSFEEIKRSVLKFSTPELFRFLKTALTNELKKAAVLLIDVKEKIKESPRASAKKEMVNAFSQTAFSKLSPEEKIKTVAKKEESINSAERKAIISEIKDEIKKNNGEFIDKKTGHIYIKEENDGNIENKQNFRKMPEAFLAVRQKIAGIFTNYTRNLKEKSEIIPVISNQKKNFFSIQNLKNISNKIIPISESAFATTKGFISRIFLPRFSKLKNIFLDLEYNKKIYAILAIILLLAVPYIIVKMQNKTEENTPANEEISSEVPPQPLENEKNVINIENVASVFQADEPLINAATLGEKSFFSNQKEIINPEEQKRYTFPQEFGSIKLIATMDDLNLLFVLTENNAVYSWSPNTGKFQPNQIDIPQETQIAGIETYLTYLYILDSQNKQIYRYPRAEGGFGEKVLWIKETLEFDQIKDFAISDNVYIADKNGITKLYRGKKEDFKVEETSLPVEAEKIYTKVEDQYIYVLDKNNSRIVKLDLNGGIVSQYYHPEISKSPDFTVSEETRKIYFSDKNEIKSFDME